MVMFRFADDATSDEVIELCRGLAGEIEEVADLQIGRDVAGSDRSYDVGMLMSFEDRAAFERYHEHPAHVPVARWIDGNATEAVSVDWQD